MVERAVSLPVPSEVRFLPLHHPFVSSGRPQKRQRIGVATMWYVAVRPSPRPPDRERSPIGVVRILLSQLLAPVETTRQLSSRSFGF